MARDKNTVARFSLAGGLIGPRRAAEVIMSREDFETLYEAYEDMADLQEARAIRATLDPADLVPLEVVKAELKLRSRKRK